MEHLAARLTGPVVLELQAVFVGDWYLETDQMLDGENIFPEPPVTGDVFVQTLPSGPNYSTENYQRLLVAAFHAARRHVVMTTPYFVPDDAFLEAMQTVAFRGVDIDLIVPQRNNHVLVGAASRAYFGELLDVGVRIHLYTDGLLHAKTVRIDDEVAFIGTSNFDIRSFALNFELNLLLYGTPIVDALRAHHDAYLARSEQLDPEAWRHRPVLRQTAQNLVKLLSPLL